jgi:hypothetical protein
MIIIIIIMRATILENLVSPLNIPRRLDWKLESKSSAHLSHGLMVGYFLLHVSVEVERFDHFLGIHTHAERNAVISYLDTTHDFQITACKRDAPAYIHRFVFRDSRMSLCPKNGCHFKKLQNRCAVLQLIICSVVTRLRAI